MSSDCEKMRDRIADLVTEILPETEAQVVARHVGECPACREYAEALQEEDRLLDSFVAGFGGEMGRREQEAIEAVSRFETWGRSRGIRSVGAQIKGVLTKHAAAAVVVVAVGLYFAITFSWVTQITALIRYGL
ncbi:MAG: anti-sigma factor family protein [Planctomycetota bacterium]|jgi:predicted anti-sigma-YlaC factor YlaD